MKLVIVGCAERDERAAPGGRGAPRSDRTRLLVRELRERRADVLQRRLTKPSSAEPTASDSRARRGLQLGRSRQAVALADAGERVVPAPVKLRAR